MGTNAVLQNINEWLNTGGRMDIDAMRPTRGVHQNGLLSDREWERLDDEVLTVAQAELVGVADLINRGLTQDLGGLGTIISTWERLGGLTGAEISFTGTTRGERDRIEQDYDGVPVPIIFKDFELNLRFLLASRNRGEGLDLTTSRAATEEVARLQEYILFKGSTAKLGSYSIYGYTTHPNRLTLTAPGVWSTAGNAYKTVKAALGIMRTKNQRGPYGLYVNTTNYDETLDLYGSLDNTELGIIREQFPELEFIKPSWDLVDGEAVMVNFNKRSIDLGVAEGIQPLQWAELGGFLVQYRIFSAMVPRIKVDKDGQAGVLHITGM